jgi:hypothetical protein
MTRPTFDRSVWAVAHADLSHALDQAVGIPVVVEFGWPIFSKTISEIGGRLLEDWLLRRLQDAIDLRMSSGDLLGSRYRVSPVAAREIADIQVEFEIDGKAYHLFLSVKAANLNARDETFAFYKQYGILKKRPGQSHPNLISVEKALSWWSNDELADREIALLYLRYIVEFDEAGRSATFKIQNNFSSQEEVSLLLIRDISAHNVSPIGSLGKGQIQLHRLTRLETTERTREEFVTFIENLRATAADKRPRRSIML